jgi:hypothetical protein
MDYSDATGAIAVGGNTQDGGVLVNKINSGDSYPIIALWEGNDNKLAWIKYFQVTTHTVGQMAFSTSGKQLAIKT